MTYSGNLRLAPEEFLTTFTVRLSVCLSVYKSCIDRHTSREAGGDCSHLESSVQQISFYGQSLNFYCCSHQSKMKNIFCFVFYSVQRDEVPEIQVCLLIIGFYFVDTMHYNPHSDSHICTRVSVNAA